MLAAMDEKTRTGFVTKLMRKLQVRERLLEMAGAARAALPQDQGARELARLKDYLDAWVQTQEEYFPWLGMPSSTSFAPEQTNCRTATEYAERSDRWVMMEIHQAIEDDLPARPEGSAMRLALRVRWLNEAVGARVYRAGRLAHLNSGEVDALADRAERELVVIVKKRGVPL